MMFDYYGIATKDENKGDLVHSKFEGIIFYIKIYGKQIFQGQDSSNFTGGKEKVEYCNYLL